MSAPEKVPVPQAPTKENMREIVADLASNSGLKHEKIEAAIWLALPAKARPTYSLMADELGIHRDTFWRYSLDPKVKELARQITHVWFLKDIPDVLEKLKEMALVGDTKAAALFLQYAKELVVSLNINVNVRLSKSEVDERIAHLRKNAEVIDVPAVAITEEEHGEAKTQGPAA